VSGCNGQQFGGRAMQTNYKELLCVDDQREIYLIIADFLGKQKYRVEYAQTAKDALKQAHDKRYDLLILDNFLDDGFGIDLCRKVREFDKEVPILLFTDVESLSLQQEAFEAGANKYLVKPDINKLKKTIEQYLDS
jgi:DNA-binding response OmpR family regulator